MPHPHIASYRLVQEKAVVSLILGVRYLALQEELSSYQCAHYVTLGNCLCLSALGFTHL